MKKRIKMINIGSIIVNILLLIFMILSLIVKENKIYAFYWLLVTLMLLSEVLYISTWSKVGIDIDKHKSKTINRSFNDITTFSIVISGLLYLSVMFLEMINESIKSNVYAIILVYVFLTIALLFNYLAVYNANKETKELVEKTFNNKKNGNL